MASTLVECAGSLTAQSQDLRVTPLGDVTASVQVSNKFDYAIIVNDSTGKQLFSQPLTTDNHLSFPAKNAVEWILERPQGDRLLLRLTLKTHTQEFRDAVARGVLEHAYRGQLEKAVPEEDREWATEAVAGVAMADDDGPSFGYAKAAPARVAALADYDDDDDRARQEEEEEEDTRAFTAPVRTPAKPSIRTGGAAATAAGARGGDDDDGLGAAGSRSARKGKITTLVAGMNKAVAFAACGGQLGMYKHTDDGELEYLNRIRAVKDKDGEAFTPAALQLHQSDRKLLMLDADKKDRVYNLDIETGKVTDEWFAKEGTTFASLAPRTKYAQVTDESLVVGVSDSAVFSLDPRISQRNKTAEECAYAASSKAQLRNAATTESGYLAVGSETGEIRLFNKLQKGYCKTVLPGLGNAVTAINVTGDGQWVLATTKTYLILMGVGLNDAKGALRSGFDVRMGAQKPAPIKLTVLPADLVKYGITELNFSPAVFNTGTLANSTEEWICSATGPWVITWDFAKVKKGIRNAYKISRSEESVVMDMFRHNYANDLLVAEQNSVYMSHINRN